MDGPDPRVVDGGPLGAAVRATSGAALATAATATPAVAAARGTPSRLGRTGGASPRGGRRSRCLAGSRSDENRRGRSRGGCHVENCKAEVGANVCEVGKRLLARDELCHELKSLAETAQDVEHQGAVLNVFA
jgi:hypothetical protein